MNDSLTNLLPSDRLRTLRRGYYARVAAVAVFLVALLIVAQGALLIPSYWYASQEIAAHEAHLEKLEGSETAAEGKTLADRLVTLADDAGAARILMSAPSASAAIRSILAVPRPGVVVSRFTVESNIEARQLTVSGIASSRDALRSYHLALQSLSFVEYADLPLSAYTPESDIPFSIALTVKTP